jgi:hypothetical protein
MSGIADVNPVAVIIGDGSRGPFPFEDVGQQIPFAANSHLHVARLSSAGAASDLVLGVHYDLTVTFDSATSLYTAEVELRADQDVLAAASGSTPAERLVIYREQPLDQSLAIAYNQAFPSRSFNQLHNKILQIAQEQRAITDRAVLAPRWENGLTLGDKSTEKGKVLGRDPNTGALTMLTLAEAAEAASNVILAEFEFEAEAGGQAAFTLSNTSVTEPAALLVHVGGAVQPASAYTLALDGDDTVLTFGEEVAEGVTVLVRVLGSHGVTDVGGTSVGINVFTAASEAAARLAVGINAVWDSILTATTVLAGLALQLLHIRIFVVDYYIAINSNSHTLGIRAACSAANSAGGMVWYTPGKQYNPYPDASDTSPLGSFSSVDGVFLAFNGSKHYVARSFTDGQTIFPYIFEDTDNCGWGGGTMEQAQKDAPTSSPLRGTCWITLLNRNEGVRGGPLRILGGKEGVSLDRDETDRDLRSSDVKLAIHGSNLNKPLGLRNSGTDVEADVVAVDCARGLIAYGFDGLNRIRLRRYSTGASGQAATHISANGTGSSLAESDTNSSGLHLDYYADGSHGAYLGTNHLDIEFRGAEALTMRNIHIHTNVDADQSGTGSQQLIVFRKRDDDTTVSTTTRNHVLEDFRLTGSYRGTPNTRWADIFKTSLGDWAGETIRKFFADVYVTGHASASYEIDYDGFVDGPVMRIIAPGTVTETGTKPDSARITGRIGSTTIVPRILDGGTGATTARGACANLGTWSVLAASAVQAVHTGTASETAVATITIPAGAMGANGMLRVTTHWGDITNDASGKTLRVRLGGLSGTTFWTASVASTGGMRTQTYIANRNNAAQNVGSSVGTGFNISSGGKVEGTVNTANAQDLVISVELADTADTVKLESYLVELFYQA